MLVATPTSLAKATAERQRWLGRAELAPSLLVAAAVVPPLATVEQEWSVAGAGSPKAIDKLVEAAIGTSEVADQMPLIQQHRHRSSFPTCPLG